MPGKTSKRELPRRFLKFRKDFPDVAKALESLGAAASSAGPLDRKEAELIRLAIAIGAREEGGVHSHTRRAMEVGATAAEIRHIAVLSIATIGFPNAMAAMSWIEDILGEG